MECACVTIWIQFEMICFHFIMGWSTFSDGALLISFIEKIYLVQRIDIRIISKKKFQLIVHSHITLSIASILSVKNARAYLKKKKWKLKYSKEIKNLGAV